MTYSIDLRKRAVEFVNAGGSKAEALRRHVQLYPDALLRERAELFEVRINAIWSMMRNMKLTYKKSGKRSRPLHLLAMC